MIHSVLCNSPVGRNTFEANCPAGITTHNPPGTPKARARTPHDLPQRGNLLLLSCSPRQPRNLRRTSPRRGSPSCATSSPAASEFVSIPPPRASQKAEGIPAHPPANPPRHFALSTPCAAQRNARLQPFSVPRFIKPKADNPQGIQHATLPFTPLGVERVRHLPVPTI